MKWVIIFVMLAGSNGQIRDVEYVPSKLSFVDMQQCRNKAAQLTALAELPPVENGLLEQYYFCVAN